MPSYPKPPTVNDDERAVDIYRRAARLINERGFRATSMGDIAETVDLTKGGLYYYIKGKSALLYAIMSYAMDRLENEVLVPAQNESEPAQRLACLLSNHLKLVLDEPDAMNILSSEEEGLTKEHQPKVQERKEAYTRFLRDSIRAVFEARGLKSHVDANIAAYSILGMMQWVVRWRESAPGFSREDLVAQITHLVLYGLISNEMQPSVVV